MDHEVHDEPVIEHAGHGGEGFWTEFLDLLANPAHWAFEVTGEVATSLIAYPFIRLAVRAWVKAHDRKVHSVPADSNKTAEEAIA